MKTPPFSFIVMGLLLAAQAHGQTYSIPVSQTYEAPASGTDGIVVAVSTSSGSWTAQSSTSWLHTSGSGAGPGLAVFSFDANTGPTRSGTLTVAGQQLVVVQTGSSYVLGQTQYSLMSGVAPSPGGLAVDSSGNVFVADNENSGNIYEYAAATQSVSLAGPAAYIYSPGPLAVTANDTLYDLETGGSELVGFIPPLGSYLSAIEYYNQATSITLSPSGVLYIGDSADSAIYSYNLNTNAAGTPYQVASHHPRAVASDAAGLIYFSDFYSTDQICLFNPLTGGTSAIFTPAQESSYRYSLAVDPFGNIYSADLNWNSVSAYSQATGVETKLPGVGAGYLAVDNNGDLYVTADQGALEIPRAYVDTAQINAGPYPGAGATDTVFPATLPMNGIFAPASDASWLTILSASNGVIKYSLAENSTTSSRTGHINVFGESIPVVQVSSTVPLALDGTNYIDDAKPIKINVSDYAVSPQGLPLTTTIKTAPTLGKAIVTGSMITYTPKTSFANVSSTDTIEYTVTDSNGNSASATFFFYNPFAQEQGQYTALLFQSGYAEGLMQLDLDTTSGFTGSLYLGGTKYSFNGAFGVSGTQTTVSITQSGKLPPITLTVSIDGNLINVNAVNQATTYTGTGQQNPYSETNPASIAGAYTGIFPELTAPYGLDASATASVNSHGQITGINVTYAGIGFLVPPRVFISGTDNKGKGAAAISSINMPGGGVTQIVVTSSGAGYPAGGTTVTIDSPWEQLPLGNGWCTMTVDGAGAVTMAGKLGDGTPFTYSGYLDMSGSNPELQFYVPLYTKLSKPSLPGSISGIITFESESNTDADGMLTWYKPAQTTDGYYAPGFNTLQSFEGSKFTPPVHEQVLTFTDKTSGSATFTANEGDLPSPVTQTLSVSSANAIDDITAPGSRVKMSLKVNSKTGELTGSLFNAGTNKTSGLGGVVFQKTNTAAGDFLGTEHAGNFVLTPQ